MGWLSLFKRKSEDDAKATSSARDGPGDPAVSAQAARTGARHRLLGAVILLAVGVIGFPLVFETQPRPIAIDIPIEIPRKDAQLPLEMPLPKPAAVEVTAAEPAVVPSAPAPAPVQALPDNSATQGRDKPASSAPPPTAAPDAGPAAGKPAPERPAALASAAGVSVVAKSTASAPAPAKPPAAQSESARAKALLEGGAASASAPAPAKSLGRFVVQVGAFADASAAREVRLKVEKLGFKTYTQITETTSGKRIRVRVGPLATREEADAALGRLKASGLAAVVLTL